MTATIFFPVWAVMLVTVFLSACAGPATESSVSDHGGRPGANPFLIAVEEYDFQDNPDLLDQLMWTPHWYFRFINQPFTRLVCNGFEPDMYRLPEVNLHGDAHLEQYAVTAASRGLEDFDAATYGPAVIDLTRFCTSLRLACRQRGWSEAEQKICGLFLQNYLDAVRQPALEIPEPQAVTRIRLSLEQDRSLLIQKTESLMRPLQISLEHLLSHLRKYSLPVLEENADLAPGFFKVKRAGELKIGIGSALATKYLLRIEGPSDAATDDVFLEAREVHSLTGIDCIGVSRPNDPLRILTVASRLCRQPDRLAGYYLLPPDEHSVDPRCFRIRTWALPYEEISITESLTAPRDLEELAADVGMQLGRGHPLGLADPHETMIRRELEAVISELQDGILALSLELADLTEQAWSQFRNEMQKGP